MSSAIIQLYEDKMGRTVYGNGFVNGEFDTSVKGFQDAMTLIIGKINICLDQGYKLITHGVVFNPIQDCVIHTWTLTADPDPK